MIAPNEPDSSMGEYSFTISGTTELKTPTEKPCKILPRTKNYQKPCIKTIIPEKIAMKSTMIKAYLIYLD